MLILIVQRGAERPLENALGERCRAVDPFGCPTQSKGVIYQMGSETNLRVENHGDGHLCLQLGISLP